MAGASGFEPPASWPRTMIPRRIHSLALGTTIALDSQPLLVFKQFRQPTSGALATLHNASMHGVGTVLGTMTCSCPFLLGNPNEALEDIDSRVTTGFAIELRLSRRPDHVSLDSAPRHGSESDPLPELALVRLLWPNGKMLVLLGSGVCRREDAWQRTINNLRGFTCFEWPVSC
jgi:hypothetical protein